MKKTAPTPLQLQARERLAEIRKSLKEKHTAQSRAGKKAPKAEK